MNSTRAILVSLPTALFALAGSALAQNDECAGALALPLGATTFNTSGATLSATQWTCLGQPGPDLWYVFTAPSDGRFAISTCAGSSYDTALQLFTGPCSSLVLAACNDDDCPQQLSRVEFAALAGDQFTLRVGGYNGASGAGTLTAEELLPVLNPANGHYYEVMPMTVPWDIADQMASSMSYMGLPGHLVTINDAAEDQFVYFTLDGGALGNSWLGGFQDLGSPNYSEPSGGWTWVTGEPFTYTNWTAGEPNDGGNQEHYLGYWPAEQWNDYVVADGSIRSFVIEYEASGVGLNYCMPAVANSTGMPGAMGAIGSPEVAVNNVTLVASSLPAFSFGFFFAGRNAGFVMNPSGSQGHLCLSGAIGRYVGPGQIQQSNPGGVFSLSVDLGQTPQPNGLVQVLAGETWRFQAWYRDSVMGMATSNFTDGLQIDFL